MAKKNAVKAKGKAKGYEDEDARRWRRPSPAEASGLKVCAKKTNGNGLPRCRPKPWGKDGKALDGVKILDFTHVSRARPARSCWPGSAPT
jgi:formyl-CoA transferase